MTRTKRTPESRAIDTENALFKMGIILMLKTVRNAVRGQMEHNEKDSARKMALARVCDAISAALSWYD